MIKQIIGGVVATVIGGTTYAISQTDVVNNFSKNSGMSQQQAQQYVNNIPKNNLESFGKVGQDFVSDGNAVINDMNSIDCVNYTYQWESSSLNCQDGKIQLQTVGTDEVTLGNCFQVLDTDLGSSANAKINECISDIDTVDSDYSLPIVSDVLDNATVTNSKNTNAYNKSVLEAALKSN